ncbi:DUF418 domain-containing protein [Pseudonocardia nigra]|uniref:DUF418 domain-containing protein n=1 Tax=Pseudonocardia nigra TaxID=1921578 RepID=UPI001C60563E|nr:DUF418 domain-containing protein [Pseudonocardia nigra]
MTTAAPPPADPGATPTTARALAPDLARGGMLLLIALANVHVYVFGHPLGLRSYPADLGGVDALVAAVQLLLVDGRAYPLFGFLFGYGIVQLSRRRDSPATAVRIARRRGWWMLLIGAVHGVLLWPGDIVGAYGLLAVLLAGALVAGRPARLRVLVVTGLVFTALFGMVSVLPPPGATDALLPSMTTADPVAALVIRTVEWGGIGLLANAVTVFAAVPLGAWVARRGVLDAPAQHRRLLLRAAAIGLPVAVLGGVPLALMVTGPWAEPSLGAIVAAGALHTVSGYAGGLGYAALFGLLAIRLTGRRPGPLSGALAASGQRSLSCYLAQSVAFVALLPAWTLGLGAGAHLWQTALVAVGTWAVILLVAAWSAGAGLRGPAELLLRRLTYGPRRVTGVARPAGSR